MKCMTYILNLMYSGHCVITHKKTGTQTNVFAYNAGVETSSSIHTVSSEATSVWPVMRKLLK